MSKKKAIVFRSVRKAAYLSRKVTFKAANFSGRVENKADRILHGTDPTVQIHDTELLEKVLAEALPEIVPIYPALPRAGRQSSVTLFLPSLQQSSFFGGTATALIVAALVSKRLKKPLRVIETLVHGKAKPSMLVEFLNTANIGWSGDDVILENLAGRKYNHYGYLDMHPEDTYIASAWWDAHNLDRLPLQKKFIYLVQDFEPIFYNNSDRYALAEATYHSEKYVALCNTKLMYDFMVDRGYKNIKSGTWFEPAVSRLTDKPITKVKSAKKRLFLYGRPGVERNLYFTALAAIEHAFANNYLASTEWEVIMAGQDNLPDIHTPSGVLIDNLGKMDMPSYIQLMQSVDIAVSPMMAPHPNYPTLEFAAAGAAVVTTRYGIKQDLSKYSKNIVMADISVESLAGAIKTAAQMSVAQRVQNKKSSTIGSSWVDTLDKPVGRIIRHV